MDAGLSDMYSYVIYTRGTDIAAEADVVGAGLASLSSLHVDWTRRTPGREHEGPQALIY